MQIGNRFRCLDPAPALTHMLVQWIGCQRYTYNGKVGEDRYFRTFARKSLAHTGEFAPIDQQYSHFKTELTPWLSDVPSQVLRNGAVKWKQAYTRFFQQLGGRPTIQKKHGKQSVWLTSELFRFVPRAKNDNAKPSKDCAMHDIEIGTEKHPIYKLSFKADRPYQLPKSIHISVHNGKWHVSFNYDDGVLEPSERDVADWLMQFTESELLAKTLGGDRGVNLPLMCSDGRPFEFLPVQVKRLAKCDMKSRN